MPQMYVESEYDMDQAISEIMQLVKITHSTLDVKFHNKRMVHIFLDNLALTLKENKINPADKSFNLNIMVEENEQA